MNGYLEVLKKYKYAKDLIDFVEDVQKLRFYYANQQYEAMMQHISNMVVEYPIDARFWNLCYPNIPSTYEEAYASAEIFLRIKGLKILLEKSYNLNSRGD